MRFNDLPQESHHHLNGRFKISFELISSVTEQKILDIGSGNHAMLERYFKDREVIGIDLSIASARRAKMKAPHSDFIVADARMLPIMNECFGIVSLFAILGMLPSGTETMVLKEAKRILKKGGSLVLLVTNDTLLMNLLSPVSIWHSRHYTLRFLEKNLEEINFRIIRVLLTGSMLSAIISLLYPRIIFFWRVFFCNILKMSNEPYLPLTTFLSKLSSKEFVEFRKNKRFLARFIFIHAKK